MAETIRLSTIQTFPIPTLEGLKNDPFADDFVLDDLFETVERAIAWNEKLFEKAAENKCNLTVVTEDFSRTGMCKRYLDDRSIFRAVVEKQTPLIAERLCAAAKKHNMYIVACYYVIEDDKIYNVADLFGPKGEIVGRYRKVHLPQYELWQVEAGDSFPAFETDIGWIGMIVCYDQMWPEATQACAMNGAQVICQPSAAVLKDHKLLTRAADAQVHFITSSAYHSRVASPRGRILADAAEMQHTVVWADVDLNEATKAHPYFWENLFSGLRDHKERHLKYRRQEAYSALTDPHPPLGGQYPEGGVADSPEDIERVYKIFKEMYRKQLRGEEIPWGWDWDPMG